MIESPSTISELYKGFCTGQPQLFRGSVRVFQHGNPVLRYEGMIRMQRENEACVIYSPNDSGRTFHFETFYKGMKKDDEVLVAKTTLTRKDAVGQETSLDLWIAIAQTVRRSS